MFCFQGVFRDDNFNAAMALLQDAGDAGKGDQRGRKGGPKRKTCFLICFNKVV